VTTPLLETRGLTRRFGGVTAVDGVDFRLVPGELRCLVGPNGAGKSTFFKMLCGLIASSDGEILLRGERITGSEPHEIAARGVGIKTQVPSLYDGLSVRESLEIAAMRRLTPRQARAVGGEILDRVGLNHLAERLVGYLAHGQRQWVELGTVLAGNPDLILLDEPIAGMTHDEVGRTEELIREINRDHALIIVEHDMQFVRRIAKKVTVFHQGRVLVEDDVHVVLADTRVHDVYLGKKRAHHA
jgi:branched-chain amino acid transport system ATP-binding protein